MERPRRLPVAELFELIAYGNNRRLFKELRTYKWLLTRLFRDLIRFVYVVTMKYVMFSNGVGINVLSARLWQYKTKTKSMTLLNTASNQLCIKHTRTRLFNKSDNTLPSDNLESILTTTLNFRYICFT